MSKMSGQSLNDRLMAARHTIAGQGLARVVCKATTEEVIGPKKKHLDCKWAARSCACRSCLWPVGGRPKVGPVL